jgi:hypothetical protein
MRNGGSALQYLMWLLAPLLMVSAASAADHAAVLELGADVESELPATGARIGPNLAVEVTPIEEWLELELGVSALKQHSATEWETDLLFKKPYTLSSTVEFMAGLGPTWTHSNESSSNTAGAEVALDFMFWPARRWGWFLEPSYGVDFNSGHSKSAGISFGILLGID